MQHHAKSDYKRLSGSEDTIWTKSRHMDTVISIITLLGGGGGGGIKTLIIQCDIICLSISIYTYCHVLVPFTNHKTKSTYSSITRNFNT